MKYCKNYAALLSGSVDEALTPMEESRLRDHLRECPGCRAYLHEILVLHRNFPQIEDVEPPVGFTASVMNAVRADIVRQKSGGEAPAAPTPAQIMPKRRRKPWKALGPVAACLVLAALVGGQGLLSPGENNADAVTPAMSSADTTVSGQSEDGGVSVTGGQTQVTSGRSADDLVEAVGEDEKTLTDEVPEEVPPVVESLEPTQKSHGAPSTFALQNDKSYFATLVLTESEAGDLLEDLIPIREDESGQYYELNRERYEVLTAALSELGISLYAAQAEGDAGDLALVSIASID